MQEGCMSCCAFFLDQDLPLDGRMLIVLECHRHRGKELSVLLSLPMERDVLFYPF